MWVSRENHSSSIADTMGVTGQKMSAVGNSRPEAPVQGFPMSKGIKICEILVENDFFPFLQRKKKNFWSAKKTIQI